MARRPKVIPGVLASFEQIDAATDAIKALRAGGHRDVVVYCSHPNHELEEALETPVSPVRLFTLVGGLTGVTAGFTMTIWMNLDWPVLVGGKAIAAVPAFVAIGFELTVLIGALLSVLGVALLVLALRKPGAMYDPRFSDDRIGIFVAAGGDQAPSLERLFHEAGAVEVRHATA
jgi:ActD protein